MGLNTQNTGQISFKKLNGKAHTQQNFALTEEGISTNVQLSTHTIFGDKIESLPVTNSGLTTLYSTNGVVERVKFEIDLIPDTLIGTNQSQGYKLKLPSNYTTLGKLRATYTGGTYLYTALGRLQIVPSFFGTLKPDGTTEYDPILYQTNGSTIINKFSPINWFFDPYDGILFVQDPPISFDISASRPGFLEAFLYVGHYTDDLLTSTISGVTGTTAVNIGSGVGIFKQKVGEIMQLKSLVGTNGIGVSGTTNSVVLSYTGSTGVTITANNGLTRSGNNIHLGGVLTGDTVIDLSTKDLILKFGASPSKLVFTGSTGFNGNIDLAHSRFILGNNCQATGGSINYTFGDTNVNAGTFGAVIFGEVSEIAPGVGSALSVGENIYISGYGGIAFGRGTKAAGAESFIGGRYISGTPAKTNPKAPQSNAIGSFGWYISDTNQTNNHGGNATAGAILGGRNHNIPNGSDFSAIIGGDLIKAATGVTNTVYMPKIRFGLGANATLVTGSTSTHFLVRNATTGEIELTTVSGGTGTGSTTASNGLTKVSNDIKLGGTLNQSTTITITGSTNLLIANSDTTKGRLFLDDSAGFAGDYILLGQEAFTNRRANIKVQKNTIDIGDTITGDTLISLDGNASTISLLGSTIQLNSGVIITGNTFNYNYNGNRHVIFNLNTEAGGPDNNGGIQLKVFDGSNGTTLLMDDFGFVLSNNVGGFPGMKYGADYSSSFDLHSLVDKNYVTGLTSGISVDANNGLHKTGSNIQLGGVTEADTNIGVDNGTLLISGNTDSSAFNVQFENTGTTIQTKIQSSNAFAQFQSIDFNTLFRLSQIRCEPLQAVLANQNTNTGEVVSISTSVDNFVINDLRTGSTQTGIKYNANYSANFVNRSLVDKGYVLSVVSGITGGSFSQNVYGAKVVITASTTLNSTNFVVFCNSTIGGFTVTLPSSPVDGQVYKIKDTSSGFTHNVIVNGNGKNIDGSSTATINTNYGGIEVCYDSALNAWFIMNFVG